MRIDLIPVGDDPPNSLNVIIEVPVGGEPVKYEFDKKSGKTKEPAWGASCMRECEDGMVVSTPGGTFPDQPFPSADGFGWEASPTFLPLGVTFSGYTATPANFYTIAPGTIYGGYQALSTRAGGEVISADQY